MCGFVRVWQRSLCHFQDVCRKACAVLFSYCCCDSVGCISVSTSVHWWQRLEFTLPFTRNNSGCCRCFIFRAILMKRWVSNAGVKLCLGEHIFVSGFLRREGRWILWILLTWQHYKMSSLGSLGSHLAVQVGITSSLEDLEVVCFFQIGLPAYWSPSWTGSLWNKADKDLNFATVPFSFFPQ